MQVQTPFNTICVLHRILAYAIETDDFVFASNLCRVSHTFHETIFDWCQSIWCKERTPSELNKLASFVCRIVRHGTSLWVLENLIQYNNKNDGQGARLLQACSQHASFRGSGNNNDYTEDPLLMLPIACSIPHYPLNRRIVALLIQGGCNVNKVGANRTEPLVAAIRNTDVVARLELVEYLIRECGANPNGATSPLCAAVQELQKVVAVSERAADETTTQERMEQLLRLGKTHELIEMLIRFGASVNVQSVVVEEEDVNAHHYYPSNGSSGQAAVIPRRVSHWTPLGIAYNIGGESPQTMTDSTRRVVTLLLSHCASPAAEQGTQRHSLLHMAAARGDVEALQLFSTCRYFAEHFRGQAAALKVAANSRNVGGSITPINLSIAKNHVGATRFLIEECGVDPNGVKDMHELPVVTAVKNDSLECLQVLIELGLKFTDSGATSVASLLTKHRITARMKAFLDKLPQ